MSPSPRIALIHATRVAMEPVEAALRRLWPEARALNLLDDSLASDRADGSAGSEELDRRILALCRHAEGLGARGVLYTCSSFGAGIEAAARTSLLPVLKPNEAMFEAAFDAGEDLAMLYTFPPALDGMTREFAEEAARRGSTARLRAVLVPGALEALSAGDAARHDRLIAEAAAGLGAADAILLAQFSMASAAGAARDLTSIPVLTSPDSAVEKLRARVGAMERAGTEC